MRTLNLSEGCYVLYIQAQQQRYVVIIGFKYCHCSRFCDSYNIFCFRKKKEKRRKGIG